MRDEMATNKHRGEVAITIAGTAYPVAMTLDALARAAEALGVETLAEFEARMMALRIADMRPMLEALLVSNGHDVPAEALGRASFKTYTGAIVQLWNARPDGDEAGEAKASPPKRAT
jgi:hypothetical protein